MLSRDLIETINELAEEDMLAEEAEVAEAIQRIQQYSIFHDEI